MDRILIAEDEEQILSVMVDVLESAGYTVVGVPDGEKALETASKREFSTGSSGCHDAQIGWLPPCDTNPWIAPSP